MAHRDLFELFKKLFPLYSEKVTEWFPNGKNSIRVRIPHISDFVFTCLDGKDFRFESFGFFTKNTLKKEKK